jgi:hypothetical protein
LVAMGELHTEHGHHLRMYTGINKMIIHLSDVSLTLHINRYQRENDLFCDVVVRVKLCNRVGEY